MEALILTVVLIHFLLSYLAFRSFLRWMVVLRQRIEQVGKSVTETVQLEGNRTRNALK